MRGNGIDTIVRLTAVLVLCLLAAGCGGSSGGSPSAHGSTSAGRARSAFVSGYQRFERATNLLATAITPLESTITASAGNAAEMSKAFVSLGRNERALAGDWHPALMAFESLKPPRDLASVFDATTTDAGKVYASLRTISTVTRGSSGTLNAKQFKAGGKDLQAFATRARALAADLADFDKRLGIG
jgi:hypothetical protein